TGRFTAPGLPFATVMVRASTQGASSPERTIDLASAREIAIALERTSAIRGTVVTPAGEPVPGAQVVAALDRRRMETLSAEEHAGITDAAGRFVITGVADGPWTLRAAAPGAGPRALSSHPGVPVVHVDDDVRIEVGETGAIAGVLRYDDGRAADS